MKRDKQITKAQRLRALEDLEYVVRIMFGNADDFHSFADMERMMRRALTVLRQAEQERA